MAVTRPQNWLAGMLLATVLTVTAGHAREAGQGSGLAVPRFVSIKSDKVNVHSGPTRDHDITWIYTRTVCPDEGSTYFVRGQGGTRLHILRRFPWGR